MTTLVGDGVTDNSAAFSQIFADVLAADAPTTIQIPPGIYRVNSALNWPAIDNVCLAGSGRDQTRIVFGFGGYPSTAATGLKISGTRSGVTIRDMAIEGLANDDSACYELVTFSNTVSDIDIERCSFRYSRHSSLRCTASVPGKRYRVTDCKFQDHMTPQMTPVNGGAILGLIPQSIIRGNYFANCGNSNTSHALYGNGTNSNSIIANNIFDASSNAYCNLHFPDSTINCLVTGNQFLGSPGAGYTIAYMSGDGLIVSGNIFKYAVLQMYSGIDQLVEGNQFLINVAGVGVRQGSGAVNTHLVIRGNSFSNDSGATNNDKAIYAGSGWIIRNNDFYLCGSVLVSGPNIAGVEVSDNRIEYPTYAVGGRGAIRLDSPAGGNHRVHHNRIMPMASGRFIEDNTGLATNKFWANETTDGVPITV